MTPLLLVAALAAGQPMPKQINLVVHPAESPRFLLQWELLPPLLEPGPGDCLALLGEAKAKLKEVLGADYSAVTDELREVQKTPLRDIDRKRVRELLGRIEPVMALLKKAALAERCDWAKIREEIRTRGIGARLDIVQEVRELVPLYATLARLDLAEDRPRDAVRHMALGFRLCQRVGEGPTLINHLVAIAITTILLEQFDVILAHPKCPNLYWPLTALPSPFFKLRCAMDAERGGAYGTFPALFRLALDPDAPLPTDEEMKAFTNNGEGGIFSLFREAGLAFPAAERLKLGVTIHFKHESAMRFLAGAGFAAEKLKTWPPLVVAIVHGLVEYEEKLGRMQAAMTLPYPQAKALLAELDRELRDRSPTTEIQAPAIHLSRLLLPAVSKVLMASARTERRLAALRVVEALRLHAARTGDWPKSLAEVTAVPVPDDPTTGKPFEYKVEAGVAIVHGALLPGEQVYQELYYRLKLKGASEKP